MLSGQQLTDKRCAHAGVRPAELREFHFLSDLGHRSLDAHEEGEGICLQPGCSALGGLCQQPAPIQCVWKLFILSHELLFLAIVVIGTVMSWQPLSFLSPYVWLMLVCVNSISQKPKQI